MVAVVVPWRGGCPHREAAFAWIRARYEHAGYQVVVGETTGPAWIKAHAVADALTKTTAETLIVADADVWCDHLHEALEHLHETGWAIPHRRVHRLTPTATQDRLDGGTGTETTQAPYKGWEGGGIVAIHRHLYEQAPLDPRFVGWGHEDESWARALRCLAGPPWRGHAPLWHLWHPPQDRPSRRLGHTANVQLRDRYAAAAKNPEAMRQLLEEVSWDSQASSSTT